jgi:tetraacyldisaccharide 4'-kinase
VGIVLRGYKSHQGKSDEAELLKQLTGAIVVTNANRVAGACDAGAAGAEVIVLDDGFQHRRLRRNLDVVLIDASDPFGIGYCLPRGLLREPPSALRDAGAIVITRGDAAAPDELDHLRKRLSLLSPKAILCRAVHRPSALIDEAGNRAPPTTIAGRKVFAFCGIGNPRSFFQTLTGLGAKVVGQCALEDHCQYTDPLLEELCEDADESGAEIMVTTQKDYVKIAPRKLPLPLYQLEIEMDVVEGREELVRRLMKIL